MAPNTSNSFLSYTLTAISKHLKPHRAEALQRIRLNGLCLAILSVLASLLPLPSLPTAIRAVITRTRPERWTHDWAYRWICIIEVTLLLIFLFNIVESGYAVKYPPAPPPPTPKKGLNSTKTSKSANTTPQRPFKVLSPHSSPQPQKPFTFSPSSSFSISASGYPPSPVSTPSRVVHYPSVQNSSTNTHASSTSTVAYTPSPVVSAYRGKHSSGSVGRALDGSYLGRLIKVESDDDEEE